MLPFKAESIEHLRARFPQALIKVWHVTDPMPDRPGLHREHVFDFTSGLRLLISKDKLVNEEPEIHVSASWEWKPPTTVDELTRMVYEGWRSLGGPGRLRYIGASAKGIPHFLVENVN